MSVRGPIGAAPVGPSPFRCHDGGACGGPRAPSAGSLGAAETDRPSGRRALYKRGGGCYHRGALDRSAYDRLFELEQRHFWRIGRRRMIVDVLTRWRPPGPLRILDVGGACSLVSQELTRFGEVTVIEPDRPTAEFAARELGLDVRPGSLPDELPVEGSFDVVTLFDVLEHIDDEGPAMAAVARLVRPGGLLVVTVPALPVLWSDHDVSVHHRRRYTRTTLRPVIERAGFRIERLSYHTCLLFPLVFAQRMASRLRGVKARAEYDVKVPPAPLNRALLAVMEAERRLLRRVDLPIGSSLVAIASRV